MELNRAQLLVHDDEALNKLRSVHHIPNDVRIEHPRANELANFVEGNGDHIPVRIWLIYQAGLRFPISPILKEVMARCHLTFMQVSVNFVQTVLMVDTRYARWSSPLVPRTCFISIL